MDSNNKYVNKSSIHTLILCTLTIICLCFTSCKDDEPELFDEDYVVTDVPGFYEQKIEVSTSETYLFTYKDCSFQARQTYSHTYFKFNVPSEPYFDNLFGCSLIEFNKEATDCELDNTIIPYSHIAENAINKYGNTIKDFLLEELPSNSRPRIPFWLYCIKGSAFDGCKKLRSVKLYGFTAIAGVNEPAFKGCDKLRDIYIYSEKLPFVESQKFAINYDKVTLHVPQNIDNGQLESYPWKRFKHVKRDLTDEFYQTDYFKKLISDYEGDDWYDEYYKNN